MPCILLPQFTHILLYASETIMQTLTVFVSIDLEEPITQVDLKSSTAPNKNYFLKKFLSCVVYGI